MAEGSTITRATRELGSFAKKEVTRVAGIAFALQELPSENINYA